MTTLFITYLSCLSHDMGVGHPEQPARLLAVQHGLEEAGLMQKLLHMQAPAATREQLLRVHSPEYVHWIESMAPQSGMVYLDPDTAMNPHSLDAALHAAGAVVLATDKVMSGEANSAFCNVRPPGHHACRSRAMGFCLFNNVAVGVAHALEQYGLERVAIVDFDVHHGNGTEDIFHDDPRVMLCSTFQHPYYPYAGADSGNAHIINMPLPAGAGSKEFQAVISQRCLPALDQFQPQMIFFSAGFDAHREDTMAGLNLVEADYAWVTSEVRHLGERHAKGRMVSTLEGGYALAALGRSAAAHIGALL